MFGEWLIFVYLGLRSILMLCEQAKIGEDEVLAEYLPNFCQLSRNAAYVWSLAGSSAMNACIFS